MAAEHLSHNVIKIKLPESTAAAVMVLFFCFLTVSCIASLQPSAKFSITFVY